jgi:hypothetical protein
MNPIEYKSLSQLNGLYMKQLLIYKSILKITEEQLSMANNEAPEESLLEKINHKLSLISTVDKNNPEINMIKSKLLCELGLKEFNLSSIREKVDSPIVDNLAVTLKEIGITLKQINLLDDQFKGKYDSLVPVPKPDIRPNIQTAQNAYKVFSPPRDKS